MSRQDYSDYEHNAPRFEQHDHWQQQRNHNLYDLPRPPAHPAAQAGGGGSTLYWGDLEAWMDLEWAQRVVSLMKWNASVRVPHPGPDATANNPGYCFLTFPSPAEAATVLSQMSGVAATMPNSAKQFNLKWASSVPAPSSAASGPTSPPSSTPQPAFPKEYSIFVGDLAPEASNSDLVAVFRNPVLGLRNDREPKFIRPFLSCKSAKIMLDPVTGVSRGYGFVRFTDESDQQRALIEMHGLYCLSRPMRISPATAKFKPQPSYDLPQVQMPAHLNPSGPSMGSLPNSSLPSLASTGSSNSSASLASLSDIDLAGVPPGVLAQLAQLAAASTSPSSAPRHASHPHAQSLSYVPSEAARFGMTEESWKHQAQARAILSNLIGPNGEQLTSTDPYNTTVFVGGLSPLIAEDTLRSFFVPFGEIHYVKVPVGKNCGFVQFVHKADAERAIESMQGFPIGGSRIRLSWGRSQYKAAQAAAQAATAAVAPPPPPPVPAAPAGITPEQAAHLLSRFGLAQQQKDDPQSRRLSEEGVRALIMAQGRGGNVGSHQSNGSGSSAGAGAYANGNGAPSYGNGGVGSYGSNGSASYTGNGAGTYDMYGSAPAEQESPELARARKRAFSPFAPETTPTGTSFLDQRHGSDAAMLPMLKSNHTGGPSFSLGGFGATGDFVSGSASRDFGAAAREFATGSAGRDFSSGVGSVPRELAPGAGAREYGVSSAPRDFAVGSAPRDFAPGSISPGSLARAPRFEPQAPGAVSRPPSSLPPPEVLKGEVQRSSPPAPVSKPTSTDTIQDLNGTLASLSLDLEEGKVV